MNDRYLFAHVALRDAVHAGPRSFLAAMESPHATEQLGRVWERVQESLELRPMAPPGLSAHVSLLPGGGRMVLVRLPPPQEMAECHFVGVVVEPELRYVTLEATEFLDGRWGTILAEWVPQDDSFLHTNLGVGPPPDEAAFRDAVAKLLAGQWNPNDEAQESEGGDFPCAVCGKPGQAIQDPRGGPFSILLCPEHESGEALGTRIHCGCVALVGLLVLLGAALALWKWVL